ncbi:MAG: VanW family protein [Syntrophomonadaceae bacterium]|nr:VanW family protein [Syntrophomonadaceae bacterium]
MAEHSRRIIFLASLVVLGIICALIIYFYQIFYESDYFLPGVQIASVEVEGLTREQATDKLNALIDESYQRPLMFYYQEYGYPTLLNKVSQRQDPAAMVEDSWRQEQKRDIKSKLFNLDGSRSITYYEQIIYDKQAVIEMAEEWESYVVVEPVNPRLEMEQQGLKIIPGQSGQTINIDKTLENLPSGWADINSDIKVPIVIEEAQPQITEKDLKSMGELARYTTWYNTGEIDRSHNLVRAAYTINTRVVQPGGIFSFNQTVGKRSFETGYRDAMVIVGGKFEPGVGGGICQVSSTLYNAVLLAGLEIVERHNHNLAVAYIPTGLDATVSYGLQDFRFKNNTQYPIYLKSAAGGGGLTITIFGHLSNKKNITLEHYIDQVIPFREIREKDPTLAPGEEIVETKGMPGYVARSYRVFHDNNGGVVLREKLATDRYSPLNRIIYIGEELPPSEGEAVPPDQIEPQPEPNPEPNPETGLEPIPENEPPVDFNQGEGYE